MAHVIREYGVCWENGYVENTGPDRRAAVAAIRSDRDFGNNHKLIRRVTIIGDWEDDESKVLPRR